MGWPKGKPRTEAAPKKETTPILDPQHDKLNLGSGRTLKEGYINIDKGDFADLQLDLEEDALPFADNSISEIVAEQVLEHITNLIPLMNECQRVLRPMGRMKITVPCVPSAEAFQDPTHVRFFTDRSFNYWLESDFLFENVGESYGIKPFQHLSVSKDGWMLRVVLVKG